MAVIEIATIQVRRGQENQNGIPQLNPGEFGWAEDTEHLYIGKRIVEGAADDNNTRILTELDLAAFTLLSQNTGTVSSTYLYRNAVSDSNPSSLDPYINSTSTTVQLKLDSLSPNIADFSPAASGSDITAQLQGAINTLFLNDLWNSAHRIEARRTLLIPAGSYTVSETITLPPYTHLVGEGPDLTTISLVGNSAGIFKTVDATGNTFESGQMNATTGTARLVSIENMTLQYSNSITPSLPLLSLDNVSDVIINNVKFTTEYDPTSVTTYGLTSLGTGISLRNQSGGVYSGDVSQTRNIFIENCTFDALNIGIHGAGTVTRSVIADNLFNNLFNGILFEGTPGQVGPNNSSITHNRFQNIVNQGIFVGANYNSVASNNISSENFFVQVGNGTGLTDYVTVAQSPVITFLSLGNRSINDTFVRKELFTTATSLTGLYYNPLISGKSFIEDSAVYGVNIPAVSNTNTTVMNIPLTGSDQMATLNYQLTNNSLSRKGELIVNVASDGFMSVTDTYNYSASASTLSNVIQLLSITDVNKFTTDDISIQTVINYFNNGSQYLLIDTANENSAVITETPTVNAGIYSVTIDQAAGLTLDSVSAHYQIGVIDNGNMIFTSDWPASTASNVVVLTCNSTGIASTLEYQVNQLI